MSEAMFLIFILTISVVGIGIMEKQEAKKEEKLRRERIKRGLQRYLTFEENRKQTEGWGK